MADTDNGNRGLEFSMVGYYRRFVDGFLAIAMPLTRLLKKEMKFEWTDKCEKSF